MNTPEGQGNDGTPASARQLVASGRGKFAHLIGDIESVNFLKKDLILGRDARTCTQTELPSLIARGYKEASFADLIVFGGKFVPSFESITVMIRHVGIDGAHMALFSYDSAIGTMLGIYKTPKEFDSWSLVLIVLADA